ncbi:MAG: MFS transporter [Terracidiphilus sp.]
MTSQDQKLSIVDKVGYAFGDGASNLIWMSFIYFQLNFYTDVFGLSAAAVATMLMVTRSWDMFFDVIIGTVADRTRTRWGKFRPYLLWMALPFGIISVAAFSTPTAGAATKLIYAYVTLSLMMVVYSAINVPYSAMMGVISPDSQERTSLSSWRFTFAFLGGLVVQFSTLRLVAHFGKGNQQLGYQMTIGVYAVAAIVLFLATFAFTRERVQPVQEQKTSRTSYMDYPGWMPQGVGGVISYLLDRWMHQGMRRVVQDLLDLVANTPWLILCSLGIMQVCFVSIRGAAIVYYFKYYLGNVGAAAAFLVIGSVMSVAGTFLIQYVTPFTGRKNAFIGLMLLSTVVLVFSYWVRSDQLVLLWVYNIIYCLLTGPTSALLWAMFADTADYSEWRTGRRATGLVYSASGMSNKFGWAIGGSLAAALLAFYGFKANVMQTAAGLHGIRIIMALAPAAGTLLCGLGMFLYPLNEESTKKLQTELAARLAQPATSGD